MKYSIYDGEELTTEEIALMDHYKKRALLFEERKKQNLKKSFMAPISAQDRGRHESNLKPRVDTPAQPKIVPKDIDDIITQKKEIIPVEIIKPSQPIFDQNKPLVVTTNINSSNLQNDSVVAMDIDSGKPEMKESELVVPKPENTTLIRKKVKISRAIVPELSKYQLDSTIYDASQLLLSSDWNPSVEFSSGGRPKEFILNNFGFDKYQTIAFKISVPEHSHRFAINICPYKIGSSGSAQPSTDIYFQFNPRYYKKMELVQSIYVGNSWLGYSRIAAKDLRGFPSGTFTLLIQARPEGFVMSVNKVFLSLYRYHELTKGEILSASQFKLQLPLADDFGKPEVAVFHQVWWGRRVPSEDDFVGFTVDDSLNRMVDETIAQSLYVGGLPKETSEEYLRMVLEELFKDFAHEINVVPAKGFAFVKLESFAKAAEAVKLMNNSVLELEDEDENNDDSVENKSPKEYTLIVSHARSAGGSR